MKTFTFVEIYHPLVQFVSMNVDDVNQQMFNRYLGTWYPGSEHFMLNTFFWTIVARKVRP